MYFWSHDFLLHVKEYVKGKVLYTHGGGRGGIAGHVEEEVARASRSFPIRLEHSVFLSTE